MQSHDARDASGPRSAALAATPATGWLAAPLLGLTAAAVFLLAWTDVLPGGWRLRGAFEPAAERAARQQAEHALARLAVFERENRRAPPGAVAFLGSSTIERFPLADCFPGRACLGRGIGMETARALEQRLARSLPADDSGGAGIAGFVLSCGRVEHLAGADAAAVRAAVGRVIARLDELAPDAHGVLLGFLPARRGDAAEDARLARVDAELAALALEHGLAFVPTARPPLIEPSGALSAEFSADDLHLDEAGYRHLSRWIVAEGGPVGRLLAP